MARAILLQISAPLASPSFWHASAFLTAIDRAEAPCSSNRRRADCQIFSTGNDKGVGPVHFAALR